MQWSILDRLVDLEPDVSTEPVQYRTVTYSQLRGEVESNLENLLNTKCFTADIPDNCLELRNSLLAYGISDFTSKNPATPSVRSELRQEIERAIILFEPRLNNVSVKFENQDKNDRRLKFTITALLKMDNESEPVNFATYYDINRCEYNIST